MTLEVKSANAPLKIVKPPEVFELESLVSSKESDKLSILLAV